MSTTSSAVLPHGLDTRIFRCLQDKRVALASSSPRRRELLEVSGLKPEIVLSTFPENLPYAAFVKALAEYPIATGTDTVVIFPPRTTVEAVINNPIITSHSSTDSNGKASDKLRSRVSKKEAARIVAARILEKPADKDEQSHTISTTRSPVLPHALDLPIFRYLKDKRVVLASSSPRRIELLEKSGLKPEVITSTFPEDLAHADYATAPSAYPVATAMEVYQRLIAEDEKNAPGLVISGYGGDLPTSSSLRRMSSTIPQS
ncbi:hypothetical protein QFC21_002237 [Naganishia friedmannii]|uniref:Uncharacterized protein n=1 Tax=Naganishia friedmannii TaxID=89922 RepID=A0ACC2VXF2_9TREE|nr:hypothetical protein QFC21_002237 [Naganishia friedmannii]